MKAAFKSDQWFSCDAGKNVKCNYLYSFIICMYCIDVILKNMGVKHFINKICTTQEWKSTQSCGYIAKINDIKKLSHIIFAFRLNIKVQWKDFRNSQCEIIYGLRYKMNAFYHSYCNNNLLFSIVIILIKKCFKLQVSWTDEVEYRCSLLIWK